VLAAAAAQGATPGAGRSEPPAGVLRHPGASNPMTGAAPLRVLMAEDERMAAEVIEEGLTEAGFEVLAANDGQEALDLAAKGADFDLLLTDLKMPRLDGRELITRLRAERPDLPVVVMTGFPPPNGAVSLQAGRGPLRLLTKPIGIAHLIAVLLDVASRG
jgi:CheY-like chemotaxis protein